MNFLGRNKFLKELYVNINEVDLINNPEHLDMLCDKIKEILGM